MRICRGLLNRDGGSFAGEGGLCFLSVYILILAKGVSRVEKRTVDLFLLRGALLRLILLRDQY